MSIDSIKSNQINCLVAKQNKLLYILLNNGIELLRLTQTLWEQYFYYFDSFWYIC